MGGQIWTGENSIVSFSCEKDVIQEKGTWWVQKKANVLDNYQ